VTSGVLVIDKPAGMTSHDVVARVRRVLGIRRVGHAGTLDPEATGVLVLCVGEATRLLEYLTGSDKVYEGVVRFGVGTDTDDASGRVIARAPAWHVTREAVEEAAKALCGTIRQRPPAFSAVHVEGRRAYELARAGQAVELPERTVQIHRLEVRRFEAGEMPWAEFETACSKGTYVRALCRDWGLKLGVPAHLERLRRLRSGPFGIEQAVELEAWAASPEPQNSLLPMRDAVRGMAQVTLAPGLIRRWASGQTVSVPSLPAPSQPGGAAEPVVAVFTEQGELAGIAQVRREGRGVALVPRKVLGRGNRT
jgi:tRNA pseudouridine55 synthase